MKVGFKLKKFFNFNIFNKKNNNRNKNSGNLLSNEKPNLNIYMKRSRFIALILILVLVSSTVGGAVGKLLDYYLIQSSDYLEPRTIKIEGADFSEGEAVSLKASPSVVGIRSVIRDASGRQSASSFSFPFRMPVPFFEEYDDEDISEKDEETKGDADLKAVGVGSGVIYETKDDFAYIVTNFHVVKAVLQNSDNSEIEVHFGRDVKKYKSANVVDYNPGLDVAVLRVPLEGKKLSCVELGDSSKLNVGQSVYVIGSPSGINFNGSITRGIVSGLKRVIKLEGIENEIETFQTDAAMNAGNSGGGIFDRHGKLIGICVAKMSSKISVVKRSPTTEGIGFCLPINAVNSVVRKIIDNSNGKVIKKIPTLGIIRESDSDFIFGSKFMNGVFVKDVLPGSVAERFNINPGDIIVEFDGKKIKNSDELDAALSTKREKTAVLKVLRPSYKKRGAYSYKNIKVEFD